MGPRLASNVGGRLQACANCLEGVRPFTLFIVPTMTEEEQDTTSRRCKA